MINKKLVATSALTISLFLPVVALALVSGPPPTGNSNLTVDQMMTAVLGFLWPVFIGFAVIMFVIAAFYFFTAQGEPEGVKKARDFVIWGIVGVAVGILAFSIPFVVRNILGQGGIN